MSKLEFYSRPLVAFDPDNKEHRRWYHEFMVKKSWGHCPVRFICPDDIGHDLTIIIRNQLIEYYTKKEFVRGKSATDNLLKIRQKRLGLVDSQLKRQYNKGNA